jgi:hypothetical protein
MATDFICSILAASAGTDGQNPPNAQTRLILSNEVFSARVNPAFLA